MAGVTMPKHLVRTVEGHALVAYPEEACGFLLGRDGDTRVITEVRGTPNVEASLRSRRYTIDPARILQLERELKGTGTVLLGFYHSHPDHPAMPSATDTERAWPWYSYVILSVLGGKPVDLRAWRLDDAERVFKEEPLSSPSEAGRPSHER